LTFNIYIADGKFVIFVIKLKYKNYKLHSELPGSTFAC